jgi:hypothetical protein
MVNPTLDALIRTEEDTVEKILNSMVDEKNVAMKTDINQPLNLTRLEIIAQMFEDENLPKCALIIRQFVVLYRINRVSYKRQSRKEIIRALIGIEDSERSLNQKLSTPPTK